jgi:hypothetical protein
MWKELKCVTELRENSDGELKNLNKWEINLRSGLRNKILSFTFLNLKRNKDLIQ